MSDRLSGVQNIRLVEIYKDQATSWNYLYPNYKNSYLRQASLFVKPLLLVLSALTRAFIVKTLCKPANQRIVKPVKLHHTYSCLQCPPWNNQSLVAHQSRGHYWVKRRACLARHLLEEAVYMRHFSRWYSGHKTQRDTWFLLNILKE